MKALDRKLLRDLWRMKGQAFAITLVVMSGVAAYIMFISTMDSLNVTREKYYREYRFADIFVPLKRAPESVREAIAAIDGVDALETRVCADVKLSVRGFNEPVTARLVSIPDDGRQVLNRLYLRRGRVVDPTRDDEAVISESFAQAHGFRLGQPIGAVINGRWKTLTIVGIAMSPEFVLQMRPEAASPDFRRYGIVWMGRKTLAKAYDMDGAFNDVVVSLSKGANENDVIKRLDNLLGRYGSLGAYGRKDQLSHRLMTDEFRQLKSASEIFPTIFIFVSAFLLNVVVSRIISNQREQIAALKAFGYSNVQVGVHYAKLVVLIASAGVAAGVALGIRAGTVLGDIYVGVYRFPWLIFTLKPQVVLMAAIISIGAALLGSLHAVWSAAGQPPAEALRPEPPAQYRRSLIERTGIGVYLSQPSRIIVRNIERKPLRSLLSVMGIAVACATMITGSFLKDSVYYTAEFQFIHTQKQDLAVAFTDVTSGRAAFDLRGMDGVEYVETYRMVPVRFRNGNRSYMTTLTGIEKGSRLSLLMDENRQPVRLPETGVVLTDYFRQVLGVKRGDTITVEVLEGSKPVKQLKVAGFANQYIGLAGFMDRTALNRMMGEGSAVSGAYLKVDSALKPSIYRTLMDTPRVAGTVVRRDEVENFFATQARPMLFFTFVSMLTACFIAVGVVYNSMRIALSERSRELTSLRVLGYTRGEVSYILLGELGLLTLTAIPLGFAIGRALCSYVSAMIASDIIRLPVVVGLRSYSMAAAVTIASAVISGIVIKGKLNRLNLVEVLKTRE